MDNSNVTKNHLDFELLQRINCNDYRAFEQLFHLHYTKLCKSVFVITQNSDISEEIVSDVFLKIWEKRNAFDIQISVIAYLLRACRNAALDYLRWQDRKKRKSVDLMGDFESNYALPHEILIGKETEHIVESAIELLPDKGKTIFKMSRDNGMTYPQIAQNLNLSVKTVETHMGRSLKFLRQTIF